MLAAGRNRAAMMRSKVQPFTARRLQRLLAVGAGFGLGCIVFFIHFIITAHAGMLSIIFLPVFMGAASGLVVGVALLTGMVLRIPALERRWNSHRVLAGSLACAGVFVLVFGYWLGLTRIVDDPLRGGLVPTLHPAAFLGGWFALVFAVVNWPLRPAGSVSRRYSA